jgi:hypothetical protein
MFRLGDLEEQEFIEERDRLKREIALLKKPKRSELVWAADLLLNFSDLWAAATQKERRDLVRALLVEVRLDAEILATHIEPRPEFKPLFDVVSLRH